MNRLTPWIPFICGISIGAGILLGVMISPGVSSDASLNGYDKIKAVLVYVEDHYVDSVNTNELVDLSIQEILQHLDPHSGYYTAEEVVAMNEPLQGNFQGVGVEYNIIRDTVVVMNVIRGGPAQTAGLLTGDRLIAADGSSLVGDSASEKIIKRKLRGTAGSPVNISVVRQGTKSVKIIKVIRGSVPIYSIEAAYMLQPEIGYIRLTRFAETSTEEFLRAADTLRKQGMKKLVFDLRGNGGGLLSAAVEISDEFLPEGQMIVYTKGRADGEDKIMATGVGSLEKMPLTVLIDENSASASEIVAGAIQDNDRGTIIGRRSFGKGLVQEEKKLADGSGFRLTIARYYTPTGRCIQKSYAKGIHDYEQDEIRRYNSGELLHADSIHFPDSLKFKTPKGKVVYGGGGIMPDIFVPMDTSGNSDYLNDLYFHDIFTLWSLDFNAAEGKSWKAKGYDAFRSSFVVSEKHYLDFNRVATENKVKSDPAGQRQSDKLIRRYMKAFAARVVFGDQGYFPAWNDEDIVVIAAIKALTGQ
jgi:carboxyl-terminal processing protease